MCHSLFDFIVPPFVPVGAVFLKRQASIGVIVRLVGALLAFRSFFRLVVEPIVDIIGLQCRSHHCLRCLGKETFWRSWRWEKAIGEVGFVEGEAD